MSLFACSVSGQQVTVTGNSSVSGTVNVAVTTPAPPANTGWTSLTGTAWQTTCPSNPSLGSCTNLVDAWGSGLADTTHNWLLFAGGGHCDYFGNQIVKLNLSANPPTISLASQPSSTSTACAGTIDFNGDGTPTARHWYDGLTFDPGNGNLIGFGGDPSGGVNFTNTIVTANTGSLNPASTAAGIWANANTTISGGALLSEFGNIAAYHQHTDAIYMMEQAKFPGQLWKYTRSNNTLTLVATYNSGAPPNIDDGDESGDIDQLRDVMYIVGHGVFLKVSVASGSSYALNPVNATGCATAIAGSYPGVAFDETDGNLIIWQGGNTIWVYNPTTNACTSETYANGPTTLGSNGTFGRFRRFPALNLFAVCNKPNENCFTLKRNVVNGFTNRVNGVNVPGGAASIVSSQSFDTFPVTNKQEYFQLFFPSQITTNCSIAADGCSLQFHMKAGDFQGEPGWFTYNFSPTLARTVGPNDEIYVQYKSRVSTSMLNPNNFSNFEGWKNNIISEGDSNTAQAGNCSNTPTDFVVTSDSFLTPVRPWIYENCGNAGTLNFLNSPFEGVTFLIAGNSDFADQPASGCPHYGDVAHGNTPKTDPTCWNFVADEWFTVQEHIKVGTYGTASSVIDLWFSHAGQPGILITNAADIAIADVGGPSVTDKFGKLTLLPYATNATWPDADTFFDDLIVSNRRIPDPETTVPNAPDSLKVAANAGHPQLTWRVNSQNGTLQDDTGFLIERCTGNASTCVPNPQSGFTQIGTAATGATSFSDSTAVTGTTYTYRIRAKNLSGNSGYAIGICFNSGLPCGSSMVAP